ncbi:MAG: CoA pyrophosphatase [Dehalococcoidia bacterium]|nr:CoA pyrophosphatase [Dehalococcoidia bacterium]
MKDKIRAALGSRQKVSLPSRDGYAHAGVLLLHYQKAGADHILFTKRTSRVEHHKGEISFPGGARDPEDDSILATALRETAEELGVRTPDVEVLGELDDISTLSSRFITAPFVGTISHSYSFQPSAIEIAEVLEVPEVPVAILRDPANVRVDLPARAGSYATPSYLYGGNVIWGATARIPKQFLDLVYG